MCGTGEVNQLSSVHVSDSAASLVRSEILRPKDLEERDLSGPLHLQRLYSSSIQGRAAFFEYLKEAVQNYGRRLIIVKVRTFILDTSVSVLDGYL